MPNPDVFVLPILDKYFLYAPLHHLSAVVNRRALVQLKQGLLQNHMTAANGVRPLLKQLALVDITPPTELTGPLNKPLFLGIIPTRGCNMACRYCDFSVPGGDIAMMPLNLARSAVEAYFNLLLENDERFAEIHFFGGEPFYASELVHFVVNYAEMRAADLEITLHFEAITNGLFNQGQCQWIADHFHTIILSLDGPAEIQNLHRPAINGRHVYEIVSQNAKSLSDSAVDLILRVCVTDESVHHMPEIARWFSKEFQPRAVCFESLTPSPLADSARLSPPDPWAFARQFNMSASILERYGIDTILSTADISANRVSFCPVGQDALIVSPDGVVNACYLLERDWQRQGLDLHLGCIKNGEPFFKLDPDAIDLVRQLNVHQKPLCENCFCRYHCAGGCHVNHNTARPSGEFDDLCLQTRLVTITHLLKQLNQHQLINDWFENQVAQTCTVRQTSDRLFDWVEEERV